MQHILDEFGDTPLSPLLNDIIAQAETGGVAIVQWEFPPSKTFLVCLKLLMTLAEHNMAGREYINEQIITISPANKISQLLAAKLCRLTDTSLNETIGLATSTRHWYPKEATYDPDKNKIICATAERMMETMYIRIAESIIIEGAERASSDLDSCRQELQRRLSGKQGLPPKHLIVMTEEKDITRELRWWRAFNPKVFSTVVPPQTALL